MKTETQASAATNVAAAEMNSQEVAQSNATEETPRRRLMSFNTIVKSLGFAPLKKEPKVPKEQKEAKHLTGVTIDVASITYYNWRSTKDKWGVSEIINSNDKKVMPKARFRPDEKAITVNGEGLRYGGFISVSPEHLEDVVATLRKWVEDNNARPHYNEIPESKLQEAIDTGNIRFEQPFTILDTFVVVQPKERKSHKNVGAVNSSEHSKAA